MGLMDFLESHCERGTFALPRISACLMTLRQKRRLRDESQWLLMGTCALSFNGVGQIWLVQLSGYLPWAYVGTRVFSAYHAAW